VATTVTALEVCRMVESVQMFVSWEILLIKLGVIKKKILIW